MNNLLPEYLVDLLVLQHLQRPVRNYLQTFNNKNIHAYSAVKLTQ